ncbi:vitamin B12 ABC transporter substrate-binding protein BtuF [Rahnella sp. Lac-M11]|uniref:Vitamin B12-binding protein n=1 Tax=Rahnella contaminans TaxID=2703882 RepID=A0A6M2B3G6_9GAMM|nr:MULTISPECIES: vitamin B12 ABC transporter substrate-binding protein BtuF [Rahnella]MBU9819539.1 vitamin B12 ABC transporter substrate-binding protein BtuF [Rahnella sp. BCC 1045]NGX87615.1 vitamin B12 ABC transporter substrate-binding protein BtuF [Rahnella contaminans]
MMRRFCLLLICLSLPLMATAAPAQRVISLAPNLTELAFAAGMGDQLVGVSAYSDFPPQASKLEQVANWQGINVERIVTLKPDLVLAWRGGNPQRPLDQLTSLGIRVIYLDPQNAQDVAKALEQLAAYSPEPAKAQQAARDFRQQWQALKQKYHREKPVPAFIQFGTQPLFTASSATMQSEVLEVCGAKNVFADSRVPWPQVSREQVLSRQPQVIVISGGKSQKAIIEGYWHSLLNAQVIALEPDWFSRAGPRILLAAQQLCPQLAALP